MNAIRTKTPTVVEFSNQVCLDTVTFRGHWTEIEPLREAWAEHVEFELGRDALDHELSNRGTREFGRRGFPSHACIDEDMDWEWYTSPTGGRGWMPVTTVRLASDVRRREEWRAVRHAALERARAQYPGAESYRVLGCGFTWERVDDVEVAVTLPLVVLRMRPWRGGSGTVTARQMVPWRAPAKDQRQIIRDAALASGLRVQA